MNEYELVDEYGETVTVISANHDEQAIAEAVSYIDTYVDMAISDASRFVLRRLTAVAVLEPRIEVTQC